MIESRTPKQHSSTNNNKELHMTHRLARAVTALFLCATSALTAAQSLPADLDPQSLARLPYIQRQDTDDASKRLFDIFVRNSNSPTDQLTGPLAFAAYNPAVATALFDLHDGAVGKSDLDAHVRELAILVACRETNYDFEWNGHLTAALNAGVEQKVADVVRDNGALTGLSESDAAVIRFGRELLRDRKMSSETFAKAKELYGDKGAMDLVAVMMTYAVSGFYAIAVDQHMPAGEPTLPR
jgi:4-carboxymuconolactone decarboxylase